MPTHTDPLIRLLVWKNRRIVLLRLQRVDRELGTLGADPYTTTKDPAGSSTFHRDERLNADETTTERRTNGKQGREDYVSRYATADP